MLNENNTELTKYKKQCLYINRQPTLFRHGAPYVHVVPIDEGEIITTSPLFVEPLNQDFDGDSVALYTIHDKDAILESFQKAFLGNTIKYDQSDDFLSTIRHEALYAAFILSKDFDKIDSKDSKDPDMIKCPNLAAIKENQDLYNNPNLNVYLEDHNKVFKYGICLLNKWCGFKEIIINRKISKKETNYISQTIYDYTKNNIYNANANNAAVYRRGSLDSLDSSELNKNSKIGIEEQIKYDFYERITNLEKHLFFYISLTNYNAPTLNIDHMINVVSSEEKELFHKIPDNIKLGYLVNHSLTEKCLDTFKTKDITLNYLVQSGSRFSANQLSRSFINLGFIADSDNQIVPKAINTNLLEGLTEEEFFIGSSGTRKGKYCLFV